MIKQRDKKHGRIVIKTKKNINYENSLWKKMLNNFILVSIAIHE
jgi:hypothetical protein